MCEDKTPCSQPNCIARESDCWENDDFCFWKDENLPKTKTEKS
jgi:hypothetical protein